MLDTALGRPGAGIRITLYRNLGERYALIKDAITNADGRCDAPLLEGCLARFECRNDIQYAGGDHLIFVGRVERFERSAGDPLLYFGGGYRGIDKPEAKP